jgi:hypothetical protein
MSLCILKRKKLFVLLYCCFYLSTRREIVIPKASIALHAVHDHAGAGVDDVSSDAAVRTLEKIMLKIVKRH